MKNIKYRSSCTILSLLLITLTVMAASCGSPSQVSDEGTGAITAHAIWEGAVPSFQPSGHISMAAPAGVVSVRMTVSGTGMTAMSQTFAAGLGQGTISGVPAGSGRTLTLQGLDGSSNVIYQGTVSNLTVAANTTTNAGTVTLLPVTSRTIGGTISGLAGTVILQNNNGDNLTLTANGVFTFGSSIPNGTTYNVTVFSHPSGQTCSVGNGAGTATANVTNISVICSSVSYSIGGTVSGLVGAVELQNNNTDNLPVGANGSFSFVTRVAQGAAYNVTVLTQPSGQACSVTNGSGTANANVTNVSVTCASATPDSWQPTSTTGAPTGRAGHSAVWTGSQMIIWGGTTFNVTTSSYYNSGGKYDPLTDTWTPTSTTNAPTARTEHAALWAGSMMIVWGGHNGPDLNSGGRYNPSTDSWTATSLTNAPAARHKQSHSNIAVWTGSEMLVWGGAFAGGGSTNTGGRYNPSSDTWTATSLTGVPVARYAHSTVWTGSEMIVFGGTNGATTYDTGGRYNPTTDTWTGTSLTNPPSPRMEHSAVWSGSEMIVWGGQDQASTKFNTGGRYNPLSNTWTATSTTNAPAGRIWQSAIWTGTDMVIWGGSSGAQPGDGGIYNPASNTWTATSATGAPAARNAPTAVWTGIQMIVWGGWANAGQSTSDYVNTGGRYSPYGTVSLAHDSWQATSIPGGVLARSNHSAVWTGSLMIIWGGALNFPSFTTTGGKYDPITDSWYSPPSYINAPTARCNHSAIWTGGKMVIWGGIFIDNTSTNTGGIYNPAIDTWEQATAISGAPSARYAHSAIWTGSEMLVWGGAETSTVLLNTGGRYNPVTNTWSSALSTSGAPTIRSSHVAVWTGSEMIIWGGFSVDVSWIRVNTGGRYNPITNTWGVATQSVGAPTAREAASAVWTGKEMIVWGGWDGASAPFSDGKRYNPASDSWTASTTTSSAPEGRYAHTAVWSENQMIIWGGYNNISRLDTGSRYTP